ncbi:histidine phosphatase family protein [Granulicella arctica]|uniref:histidine phosphatase family protein n=1 Tax=Granulicella arctica TaxID=940613 RepID=UPI0021DF7F92|nr:histidine phosphatase family protein [Granulicella arctica]
MIHYGGLLVIRHAETRMAGTFCGHSDPPINSAGHGQLLELLKSLENEPIDSVYTSDLQRAKMTAEAVAKSSNAPVIERKNLREIGFGDWEGLTWLEIEQRDPAYSKLWLEAFPDASAPGGEQYGTFKKRILTEIAQLQELTINQRCAVVTHAGAMQVILTELCGLNSGSSWELTKPYCSFFDYPLSASTRKSERQR